jgi:uncharacterized repeat protein (TIGR01451 family)
MRVASTQRQSSVRRFTGRVAARAPIGAAARALLGVVALGFAGAAAASSGSYATTGTGTYAQSLWWLDMSGYSDSAASLGGSAQSFTLPNGAGTFSFTATKTFGLSAFTPTTEPASASVGAFGHGAYNGITGSPILYTSAFLVTTAVKFQSMSMVDAGGNARTFTFYAADGENTDSGESITYSTSGTYSLVDTVNYYASFNGNLPSLSGVGSATVTETGSNSASYNASYVLGTSNPSNVTTSVTNSLTGYQGVLFGISLPTVTLNVITAARSDPSDQFTATIGYTSPAATVKSVTTTGLGGTAATGAISVIGTNSITLAAVMASGSASPLSYYSGAIVCSNGGPGATGYGGTATLLPSGTGTSFAVTPKTGDNITCTLTLTPVAQTLAGTVYNDANHDGSLDNGESSTGVSGLYVKIAALSGGVCATTATAAASVNATTGAYSIPSVASGTYCLTLSTNNSLSSTAAGRPAGYVDSEAPSGVRQLDATQIPSPVQNFGLYAGASLSLVVFNDSGVGGGTGNDGVQNGGEAGLSGVALTATVSGSTIATATTIGNGGATLWLPASSGTVTVTATAPAGDLATGGSAGTTGGSYARPNVTFTYALGTAYTGVTFGLIAPSSLAPVGAQSAQPGSTLFYPHALVAGSAGQVSFATTAASSPTLSGWSESLLLDTACSGTFASGDTTITAAIAVTAGQRLCILVKEFVPAGAPWNAQNKVTVSATTVYSGSAAPATQVATVIDTTTVTVAATQLTKQVENVTQSGSYGTSNTALPGNTLQYQLTIVNQGSAALSTVVISDSTPAYTTFLSGACPGTLPSALTGCTLSAPSAGATGALQWTFSGALAPGTQTTVTYQVTVTQ